MGDFQHSPIDPRSQSVIIKTRNHNILETGHGIYPVMPNGIDARLGGVMFNVSLPFVHVVELNGRCYLHNGYHRVFGAMLAGATELPCLFRQVADGQQAGIRTDGGTFDEQLLISADPPTMAHFTPRRSFPVMLRAMSRIIHITWSQYSMPDE